MIIDYKYGKIKINPKTYHKDMLISSYHAVDPYMFILNKIKDLVPEFLINNEVVTKEYTKSEYWIFRNKYGEFRMNLTEVFKNSTPKAYLDKNKAFLLKIKEKHPDFFNKYEILGDIKNSYSEVVLMDKYGVYKTTVNNILSMGNVSSKSCLNKTNRYLNMFKERIDYENYYYDLYKFEGSKVKSKFICKNHGVFKMLTHDFLSGSKCPECTSGTTVFFNDTVLESRKSECENIKAVLYIAKIYNEEESFYKIGVSQFSGDIRLKKGLNRNYNYKILQEESLNLYEALKKEKQILNSNTKYIPKYKFKGYTECITKNPI